MIYKSIPLISVAKITHETVKPFDGEKYYMATGDLSNENTKELELVSFANRPSRADLTAKKGDLILARMKSTNKVLIVQDTQADYIYSTGFIILSLTREVDNNFLLHYLQSTLFQDEKDKLCTGATQKAINNQNFANLEIPLPPLSIQKRIAEILDAADALRRKDQELLVKYDELAQAIFIDLFGDPVKNEKYKKVPLSDVSEIANGVTKNGKLEHAEMITALYMRVANVQDGYLDLKEIKDIRVSISDYNKYQLKKMDILLTEGGDPDKLGRGCIWMEEVPNSIFQNHLFRVRVNSPEIKPYYLAKLIGSKYGKKYFLKAAKQTTGIATINSSQLKAFPVIIPVLNIQEEFERVNSQIDKVRSLCELNLVKSNQLFNSLLQQAFKGELVK